jgi:hypothetical protein
MAKTALDQLQEQIEAIRREAYAAGYAAAMQAVRDFAARPAGGPMPAASPPPPPPRAAPPARRPRRTSAKAATASVKAAAQRPRRGTNAQMIVEVLQAIAPRGARPAEIRQALQRDKGVDVAFTSIRHALGQLQAKNTVEAGNDRTWRYLGSGTSAG